MCVLEIVLALLLSFDRFGIRFSCEEPNINLQSLSHPKIHDTAPLSTLHILMESLSVLVIYIRHLDFPGKI